MIRRRTTRTEGALLAIVLLGLALRVYHLSAQSIWYDEAWSVWVSKMSLSQLVATSANVDTHPPLYYIILHYWMMIFGSSEFGVRLLSVLFGVLAIPMTYLLGRQLFNAQVGLVGALLLTLSLLNIRFSQETRMYSLLVLLTLISMFFFLELSKRPTNVVMICYVLSTAVLLYTHLYGLFVIIAQNIYFATLLFLSKERVFRLSRWIALEAIVILLFVPWFIILAARATIFEQWWEQSPTLINLAATLGSYAGTPALLALFLILSVLSLISYNKLQGTINWRAPFDALTSYAWEVRLKNINAVYFLVVWVAALNVIPYVLSQLSTPIYLWRYTIAASVALYLLVAAGVSNIKWRYAKVGVILIIGILCVANLQPYYATITRPQAREAIDAVVQNVKSGDIAIVWPANEKYVFSYYSTNPDLPVYALTNASVTGIINETHSIIEGHDRIWLAYTTYNGSEQAYSALLSYLNESYTLSLSTHAFRYDVYLFEKRV